MKRTITTTATIGEQVYQKTTTVGNNHATTKTENALYESFRAAVEENIRKLHSQPLFTTDVTDLFLTFLGNLPVERRGHYNCNACKSFFNRYASLVVIEAGQQIPIAFLNMPRTSMGIFQPAIDAMGEEVRKAKVTGQFFFSERTWGTQQTGTWSHFSATELTPNYSSLALSPGQKMAEKREEYRMLNEALGNFALETIDQAAAILKVDALARSKGFIRTVEMIRSLKLLLKAERNQWMRRNLLWSFIATAPAGIAHFNGGVIGMLFKDIQEGRPFNEIQARFNEAMNPLQYQRPSTISDGNIEQAEKIIRELGLEDSLRRRFAYRDDMELFWKPAAPKAATKEIFGHLKQMTQPKRMELPEQTMTWVKFARDVLPIAATIEVDVPTGFLAFKGFTAPAVAASTPILKWKNGIAWYYYHGGRPAQQFGIQPGWNRVYGLCSNPDCWGTARVTETVTFLIDGFHDGGNPGLALFPENLVPEIHSIRSTIEAHSRKSKLEGNNEKQAAGLDFKNLRIRVTDAKGQTAIYRLDRWE